MLEIGTTSESLSTSTLLRGIWSHLSRRRRNQLGLLLMVMLASGVAELLSLGAVLPFLAVLSSPELLWEQPLVQALAARLGYTQASQLLLPATLTFAVTTVLATQLRMANLWLNGRLAAAVGSDLSCESYKRTLYQPYGVHVQRNSAEVITGITTHIHLTVVALRSLLQLITYAVAAASILVGLLLIDAPVAVAAAALFGGTYFIISAYTQRELASNSRRIAESTTQQIKALQEGLGAIRDVLLDGSQPIYIHTYQKADRSQRQLQAKNIFLSAFPRFVLEALGMLAISLLGGLLVLNRGSGATVMPLLGALALGAQRLLPALQQVYGSWAGLKGYHAAIQDVLLTLNQSVPPLVNVAEPFALRDCIKLQDVHFSYRPERPEVIRGLSLEICRGERIGLIGSTGSGKSTVLDLLMGLLLPTAGTISIDGADLHDRDHPERLTAWRASIAHVPQSIYLADSSIAENIAFGVPRQHIDLSRVQQAAAQAQIASFIEASPMGYDSYVGERGIQLSGGQRQRIAIARALYKQAQVLVLDEATSALDIATEKALMASVYGLSKDLTVVIIAHRLSTIECCDRIVKFEQGEIVASGQPSLILPV